MTDAELRRLADDCMEMYRHDAPVFATPVVLAFLDRIDAAKALHVDGKPTARWCTGCLHHWPCPTIRALDGEAG